MCIIVYREFTVCVSVREQVFFCLPSLNTQFFVQDSGSIVDEIKNANGQIFFVFSNN